MNTPQRILVRVAVLAAVWAAWHSAAAILGSGQGDADIGLGLLAFATVMAVAAVGGLLDGRRLPVETALLIWALSAAGFAAVAAIWQAVQERGLVASALAADAVGTGVFIGVLVALPAAVGAAVGTALRHA